MNKINEQSAGICYAAAGYVLWGILPVYWKLLQIASPGEILAHRIVWSFALMIILLVVFGRTKELRRNFISLITNKKTFFTILAASLLISCNWLSYIWAVNNDHVLEASLGYYINPLVNVLLGAVVLKERLNNWQIASFASAGCGVLLLIWQFGQVPWVALFLAFSFAFYALSKKLGRFDAVTSLAFETMMVVPAALCYMIFIYQSQTATFVAGGAKITLLLCGAGAITAAPLLCFAKGVKRISMTMTGFLQYITPTITMLLGIFLYHEEFTNIHLLSFMFIWLGLAMFSLSKTKLFNVPALRKWAKF